jgi:hypothetical protein
MKYTFEMGLGVMIYKPSFVKIGSEFQKLIGDAQMQRYTDSMVTS